MNNTLYFGDNLDILRDRIKEESIDLVYLDPPFNSNAKYNILFQSPKADAAAASAEAFRDSWSWGEEAAWSYKEIMRGGRPIARLVEALYSAMGDSDLMAYLVMMTVRLHELHTKLKSSGALYLHCDPTAGHYLKVILDAIFGHQNFRSEIIWRRSGSHNSTVRQYGPIHDCILLYTKSNEHRLRPVFTPHTRTYIQGEFRYEDNRGRYRLNEIMGPEPRDGESGSAWRGYDPTNVGRHWAIPESLKRLLPLGGKGMTIRQQLDELHNLGEIYVSKGGRPKYKQRPTEGVSLQDIWAYQPGTENCLWHSNNSIDQDVKWLDNEAEKIGYPTQKPIGLLERIIRSSTDPGATVLDPFCGCGTTIEASQRLGRLWVGIDIAVHAIKVIEARLASSFQSLKFNVEGMPVDFRSAEELATRNKYQFQWWANYLFNPHAIREQKRGSDKGIDGELFFPNGPGRPWGRMLTSVKGGANIGPRDVRDFRGVLDREKAEMGLFICLYRATAAMVSEAASCGYADTVHGDIPRLQIVAIEDWFSGKIPKLPPLEHLPTAAFSTTKRRAARATAKTPDPRHPELPLVFAGGRSQTAKTHLNPVMVIDQGVLPLAPASTAKRKDAAAS